MKDETRSGNRGASPGDREVAAERMLTVRDLAELLSVHTRSIRRWVSEGELPPPIKIGGSLRWKPARIQEWIQEKEEEQ